MELDNAAKMQILQDLMKMVSEHRANDLRSSLEPQPLADMPMGPADAEMPGQPEESAPGDAGPVAEVEMAGVAPNEDAAEHPEPDGDEDPAVLQKLLAMLGG